MDKSAVTPSEDRWMLPKPAATVLGVTARTLRRWARAGKISSMPTLGGHRRYREREVFALRDQLLGEATA